MLLALLAVVGLGAAACEDQAIEVMADDEEAIYADVALRLCDQARCGPSHPAFVLLEVDIPPARAGVAAALPGAVFISTTDGLVGPDNQVIDGGRILHFGMVQPKPGEPIVLVDTFWESSRFEGKGETYVYSWDGDAWVNVEPSTVGVTVTTGVP